jgi:hypothetical protein
VFAARTIRIRPGAYQTPPPPMHPLLYQAQPPRGCIIAQFTQSLSCTSQVLAHFLRRLTGCCSMTCEKQFIPADSHNIYCSEGFVQPRPLPVPWEEMLTEIVQLSGTGPEQLDVSAGVQEHQIRPFSVDELSLLLGWQPRAEGHCTSSSTLETWFDALLTPCDTDHHAFVGHDSPASTVCPATKPTIPHVCQLPSQSLGLHVNA